ncbi:unknown [Crocosphaera subtropica ATCC 51142]|uniref:UspA domain-containing protein n=1 Tax=Crocosphaera subtropica (strain ATCC 51142 / BH68) TaxID=43989 RepID=B1WW33_CROS5|nr:universal stress protein [Crocosphaera subtropica]ACB52366.1 unknown [Crocosphaera subtropica ATCC 51142]
MSLFIGDRILVPLDFSQDSFNALDETLNYIKDPNKITVIHVLLPLESVDPGVIWSTLDDDTRQRNIKNTFYERYPKSLVDNLNLVVKIGNPSLEIVDYAKNNNIDLIVIASHGRTGLNRFLLGSVTEKVVRLAQCPVLVWRDYHQDIESP